LNNSILILCEPSEVCAVLEVASESISSMEMMLGFFILANLNSDLIKFSDSPCHLDTRSEAETEKNVKPSASPATARAMNDFPVPGT
jgi:hypothetical protein